MMNNTAKHKHTLSTKIVNNAKPDLKEYVLWDSVLSGFGLRVYPTGIKSYIIQTRLKGRVFKKKVASVRAISLQQARLKAKTLIFEASKANTTQTEYITESPLFSVFVPEFLERYSRNWKPVTLKGCIKSIDRYLLPFFLDMPIHSITRQDVLRWHASLSHTPGNANRTLPILSMMMKQAEIWGYRIVDTNPCKNITRYKRSSHERFLTEDEYHRLGKTLRLFEVRKPQAVAIIRLLTLTGCRKSEILSLQWEYIKNHRIFLPDSKTGAKTVYLSTPAIALLDQIPKTDSPFVFPMSSCPNQPATDSSLYVTWCAIREAAHIEDFRLHDLRHSYASIAIQNGESLIMIGKLLGHALPETTMKYAHLSDKPIRAAANQIASTLSEALMPHVNDATLYDLNHSMGELG